VTKIRIANAHTDSPYPDVEEREREADVCLEVLGEKHLIGAADVTSSTLSVYAGDLNTVTTSELNYITSQSFRDSITVSDMDATVENPQSATIGLTFALPEYAPRRWDFIMYRGGRGDCWVPFHLGEKPITDWDGLPMECVRGVHGWLYPSDHLGVCARFTRRMN
jgi:hypothetical protein